MSRRNRSQASQCGRDLLRCICRFLAPFGHAGKANILPQGRDSSFLIRNGHADMRRNFDEDILSNISQRFTLDFSHAGECSNNLSDPALSCVLRHCLYSNSGSVWNGHAILPTQTVCANVKAACVLRLLVLLPILISRIATPDAARRSLTRLSSRDLVCCGARRDDGLLPLVLFKNTPREGVTADKPTRPCCRAMREQMEPLLLAGQACRP